MESGGGGKKLKLIITRPSGGRLQYRNKHHLPQLFRCVCFYFFLILDLESQLDESDPPVTQQPGCVRARHSHGCWGPSAVIYDTSRVGVKLSDLTNATFLRH